MQKRSLSLLAALLAIGFSASAIAQNNVVLTRDSSTNLPTVSAEPMVTAPIHFTSINYADPANPEPFLLRFEAAFIGQFTPAASTAAAVINGRVLFNSEFRSNCPITGAGTSPCQEVIIKLTAPATNHPAVGYKYEVIMGTEVLDPRLRGR